MEALLTLGLLSVILGTASGAQNISIFGALGVGGNVAIAGVGICRCVKRERSVPVDNGYDRLSLPREAWKPAP
jgi:hypothetical protein